MPFALAAVLIAILVAKSGSGASKVNGKTTGSTDKGPGPDTSKGMDDTSGPDTSKGTDKTKIGTVPPIVATKVTDPPPLIKLPPPLKSVPLEAEWPGVKSLPEPYRADALAAVADVIYENAMITYDGDFPICKSGGTCSSDAIYHAYQTVFANKKNIDAASSGLGGANTDLALTELYGAYRKVKAAA